MDLYEFRELVRVGAYCADTHEKTSPPPARAARRKVEERPLRAWEEGNALPPQGHYDNGADGAEHVSKGKVRLRWDDAGQEFSAVTVRKVAPAKPKPKPRRKSLNNQLHAAVWVPGAKRIR